LRNAVGIGAIAAIPPAAYGHFVGIDDLEVVRRNVVLPTLPKSSGAIKIGFISDFHCDCDHALYRIQRSVELLEREEPDVVFLGGDYVTHDYERWAPPCIDALTRLNSAPLGVYAILGNHDWWCFGTPLIRSLIVKAGFNLLCNRSVPLDKSGSVWIVGLDDRLVGHSNIEEALVGVPIDSTKLLLVHEPDYADEAPAGFALQLSGHSHGGQIRVFGLALHGPAMGRKYIEGLENSANHPVYTTRGVGVVGPQMRLDCRPEVTVLTISHELKA
jgi:predicted MPP superfamily phosphohydrolase